MNRGGGLLPSCEVAAGIAAVPGRDRQSVVVVDVAGGAGKIRVALGQQEASGAVVEGRGIPAHGGVAVRAIAGGKGGTCLWVGRIVGLIPGCKVAARIAAIGRLNF